MKKLVSTKGMSYEEWLAWRRKGIGGSDAPAITGDSPFSTQFDVWLEKTGQFESDTTDNEPMYWGRTLEEVVAREFAKRTGKKVRRVNAILQHPEHDIMLANLDRVVVGEDAGLECKTTNPFFKETDGCPGHYVVQCQHCMSVSGKSKWYIAVLVGGQRFHIYEIERDDAYINEVLIPAEKEFWRMVQENEMPPIDGSEACAEVLGKLYPEGTDAEIELPIGSLEMLDEYEQLTANKKAVDEQLTRIQNEIKAHMKDHSKAFIGDRKVFWTNVVTNRFSSTALKADCPDIYAKYSKESLSRRFQIK